MVSFRLSAWAAQLVADENIVIEKTLESVREDDRTHAPPTGTVSNTSLDFDGDTLQVLGGG